MTTVSQDKPKRSYSTPVWPPWRGLSLSRALLAGLAGTIVNTLAIHLVKLVGVQPGTGGLAEFTLLQGNRILAGLGHQARLPAKFGPIGQELFHTSMGLLMAIVYATFFYRILRGPGWWRGFLFCQIPWLMQVLVILPWMGAGPFGWRQSALTPWASFLLNGVYGLCLGGLYRASDPRRLQDEMYRADERP